MKKRLLGIFMCLVIIFGISFIPLTVSAAEYKFSLSLNSVTAVPGDVVVFTLDITDNPGIMATTFTLHYDTNVLEYDTYFRGILKKDTSAKHNGYISYVYCGAADKTGDGTLLSFQFKVKEDAPAGFSAVTIKNIRPNENGDSLKGCFANWNGDQLNPTVNSGGVTVGYTGSNCAHKFGDWSVTVQPGCTEDGIKSHSCTVCGHTAQESVEPVGHKYSDKWTIDREATAEQNGMMSRHCLNINCDSTVDPVTFSLPESQDNNFSNSTGTEISPEAWKPLEEITSERNEKEDESVSDIITQPDESVETEEIELPSADELVETAKRQDSKLVTLRKYFFGDEQNNGLFNVLLNTIKNFFSGKSLQKWINIIAIFI